MNPKGIFLQGQLNSPLNPRGISEVLRALGEVLFIPGISVTFFCVCVCSSGSLPLRAPCIVQRLVCLGFPLKGKKFLFVWGQVYLSGLFSASLVRKMFFKCRSVAKGCSHQGCVSLSWHVLTHMILTCFLSHRLGKKRIFVFLLYFYKPIPYCALDMCPPPPIWLRGLGQWLWLPKQTALRDLLPDVLRQWVNPVSWTQRPPPIIASTPVLGHNEELTDKLGRKSALHRHSPLVSPSPLLF